MYSRNHKEIGVARAKGIRGRIMGAEVRMVARLHRVLWFNVKTVAFTLCGERCHYKIVNRQGS